MVFLSCRETMHPAYKNFPITCYAATYGDGIYQSENGGVSWFPINIDQNAIHAYFKRIYLDPYHKDIFFISTTGGGLFFLNLSAGLLEEVSQLKDKNIRTMTFINDSSGHSTTTEILVGMNHEGIYKSNYPGHTWQPNMKGLSYRHVNVLFAKGDNVFAGAEKDLFRWDRSNCQWVPSSKGIQNKKIISMGADPSSDTFYAGTGSSRIKNNPSFYRSINGGQTWIASCQGLPAGLLIFTIAVNLNRSERIYIGSQKGIYRSIDKGLNWACVSSGLEKGVKILDIKVIRMLDGKDVVFAAGSAGVFMAIDEDEIFWVNRSYGLENPITSIALSIPQ